MSKDIFNAEETVYFKDLSKALLPSTKIVKMRRGTELASVWVSFLLRFYILSYTDAAISHSSLVIAIFLQQPVFQMVVDSIFMIQQTWEQAIGFIAQNTTEFFDHSKVKDY